MQFRVPAPGASYPAHGRRSGGAHLAAQRVTRPRRAPALCHLVWARAAITWARCTSQSVWRAMFCRLVSSFSLSGAK